MQFNDLPIINLTLGITTRIVVINYQLVKANSKCLTLCWFKFPEPNFSI